MCFLSGFQILISPILSSIVTSNYLTKSRPKMNRSESWRFSTTRKFIQRFLHPIWRYVIVVLPDTQVALRLAAASLKFMSVRWSFVKLIILHVFIGITLTTDPVSSSPVTLIFFPSVCSSHICFVSIVYRILFRHGVMTNLRTFNSS